jgi:hypothetical protein
MTKEFTPPDFSKGELELRFEDNVICIYGTKEGLKKLANIVLELIENPGQSHVHLENEMYGVLTEESNKGAIAIFPKSRGSRA